MKKKKDTKTRAPKTHVLGFYVEGFGPFWGAVNVERKFLPGVRIQGHGLPKDVRQFDLPGEDGDTYLVKGVGREGSRIMVSLA